MGCPFAKEASKVFLSPSREGKCAHTVSDLQTQISMFIMDHELIEWNPCKPKVSKVKRKVLGFLHTSFNNHAETPTVSPS